MSIPATSRPTRSGWPVSTPVSRTATRISGRPLLRLQADRTPITSIPHWADQYGSLGAATGVGVGSARTSKRTGGAAAVTPARRRIALARPARCARTRPSNRRAREVASASVSSAGLPVVLPRTTYCAVRIVGFHATRASPRAAAAASTIAGSTPGRKVTSRLLGRLRSGRTPRMAAAVATAGAPAGAPAPVAPVGATTPTRTTAATSATRRRAGRRPELRGQNATEAHSR